ncbi:outer membrane beta-barrel protein [Chitinophagales bacterium]|nr:outer membrane beta-barrel protein [Chitinophagales bacterium]
MKNLLKIAFLATILFCAGNTLDAQTKVGGGLTYSLKEGVGIGINARAAFGITETIDIVPSLNFFFPEVGSLMGFNGDVHYNIEAGDALNVYPLAGLNYTRVSANGFSAGEIGFNLGGGASFAVSDNLDGFAEVKYVVGDFDQLAITVGILFGL